MPDMAVGRGQRRPLLRGQRHRIEVAVGIVEAAERHAPTVACLPPCVQQLPEAAAPAISNAMAAPEIDALTQALARLPGLGPRSARRAVLHLLKRRETALVPLIAALTTVEARLATCSVCGNVDTRDPCAVCTDPRRDQSSLCVVEEVADLWALDRARLFPGRYHVLGGRLSALDGVRPEDLSIDALVGRVAGGGIDEVVLAMNVTLEGQTTMHFIADRLSSLPVRVTQLAHGMPVGGELDYLDEGTLAQALRARRPVQ
jgi:recombination protein RecR